MGSFGGSLKYMTALELGGQVIKAAIERAGLHGEQIDMNIYGNCRQAGNGANPARIAGQLGGIPVDKFAITPNCACPTSMLALILATRAIRLGDAEVVCCGGMESMSNIPHIIKGHRWDGFRLGNVNIMDGWYDTNDVIAKVSPGMTAEIIAEKHSISKDDQDYFAWESHQKAEKAQKEGFFKEEITPITVPAHGRQEGFIFEQDETIRYNANLEKMKKIKPAFKEGGTVTAANSCGMPDGATAMVVMSRVKANSLGLKSLFHLRSYAEFAVDNTTFGIGPAYSIPMALERGGLSLEDISFVEINEAFASASLACERLLNLDHEKHNVKGGAIALGHATGSSGARITMTLYSLLKHYHYDKEFGVSSICGGGGVTAALVIRRDN
ncbi:MAG: thiolase family protein [Deltaproteobacteria bacterium]|nr:thiolase family protein [Deltaproteobacteria bacterium]